MSTNQLVLVSRETRKVLTANFLQAPKLRKWSIERGKLVGEGVSITSLKQDAHMAKSSDFDMLRLMVNPAKIRRKVMVTVQLLCCRCVCHDSSLSERGTVGSKHTVKFSKGTWHHIKRIRERKGPSLGVIQKCEPHERNLCASRCKERTQDDTVHQKKKDAPAEQHGT